MRSAELIAAAVPTISFGQNLVTEKIEVPQTQSYQGFAGLVVQKLIIPTQYTENGFYDIWCMKRENGVYIVCCYPYYTVFLPFLWSK